MAGGAFDDAQERASARREARKGALWGHAAMALFATIIAGSISLGAVAAPYVEPAALNAARFWIGVAALAAAAAALGRWSELPATVRAGGLWRFLALGALYGGYFVFLFEALKTAPPAAVGAIFTVTPLLSALFGRLLLGQRAPWSVLGPLLLGALGAVWVIFRGDPAALAAFEISAAEGVFLIGCLCHALYAPLVPTLNRGESALGFATGTVIGAALLLTLLGARDAAATDWAALPWEVWAAILYFATLATAGTTLLLQFAALRLPTSKVMAYTYLTPLLVVVLEGVFGGGWAEPAVLPGALISLLALLLLLREDPPGAATPPTHAARRASDGSSR